MRLCMCACVHIITNAYIWATLIAGKQAYTCLTASCLLLTVVQTHVWVCKSGSMPTTRMRAHRQMHRVRLTRKYTYMRTTHPCTKTCGPQHMFPCALSSAQTRTDYCARVHGMKLGLLALLLLLWWQRLASCVARLVCAQVCSSLGAMEGSFPAVEAGGGRIMWPSSSSTSALTDHTLHGGQQHKPLLGAPGMLGGEPAGRDERCT